MFYDPIIPLVFSAQITRYPPNTGYMRVSRAYPEQYQENYVLLTELNTSPQSFYLGGEEY